MINCTEELKELENIITDIFKKHYDFFNRDYTSSVIDRPIITEEPYGKKNTVDISQYYRLDLAVLFYNEFFLPKSKKVRNYLQRFFDETLEITQEYFFNDNEKNLIKNGITDYTEINYETLYNKHLYNLAEQFDKDLEMNLLDLICYSVASCTICKNKNNNYTVTTGASIYCDSNSSDTLIAQCNIEFTLEELNNAIENETIESEISEKIINEIYNVCKKY